MFWRLDYVRHIGEILLSHCSDEIKQSEIEVEVVA
jgi:hypothetical protein